MNKLLLITLLGLMTATTHAFESTYVVNPIGSKGVLDLEISKAHANTVEPGIDSARSMSADTTSFGINYSRRILDNWTLGAGTNFVNKNLAIDSYGQEHRVSGFSDLKFNLKSGTVFEPLTLTYGGQGNLSPGPAKSPYTQADSKNSAGNNFSGIHSLSPFIGVESYLEDIAVGGRMLVNFYSKQRLEQNGDLNANASDSATSYTVEGFAEFPVYRKFDIGLTAAVGRGDLNLGNYFSGGNEYFGQIYSQYKFEKNSAVILALSSANRILPIEKSTAELSLGFRRSL